MNSRHSHQLDSGLLSKYANPLNPLWLTERIQDLPHLSHDRALVLMMDETNRLPIPNDLSIQIHLFDEQKTGISQREWLNLLVEQIKLLAPRFDQDRTVREIHVVTDYGQPAHALINHLLNRIQHYFHVDANALLYISAPLNGAGSLPIVSGEFGHVHLDFRLRIPEASTLDQLTDFSKRHGAQIGLTIVEAETDSDAEAITQWLNHALSLRPECLSFEPLVSSHSPRTPHGLEMTAAQNIRDLVTCRGYRQVGGATFVLGDSPWGHAHDQHCLGVGIEGYLTHYPLDQIGLGIGVASLIGDYLSINHTHPSAYAKTIERGRFPIERGSVLSLDDQIRQAVINELLCDFKISMDKIQKRFNIFFLRHFEQECQTLRDMATDGLLHLSTAEIRVTELGQRLIPAIVSVFATPIGWHEHTPQPISRIV